MVRIEFAPFGGQGHFSHVLGLPLDLDFGTFFGGPGATILLQGGPCRPFKPLLELSGGPLVEPGPL